MGWAESAYDQSEQEAVQQGIIYDSVDVSELASIQSIISHHMSVSLRHWTYIFPTINNQKHYFIGWVKNEQKWSVFIISWAIYIILLKLIHT